MTFDIFKMRFRRLRVIGSAYNMHHKKLVRCMMWALFIFKVLLIKVGSCLTKGKLLSVKKRRPNQLGVVENTFVA